MIILALDTTLSACSAALMDSATNRLLAQQILVLGKGHGEAIGPMVQAVLHEAGVAPNQIARIAVTHGPGTFTGLRIGLSLAHGMAVALQCDLVGINTLAATVAPLIDKYDLITVVHQAGATGKFYTAQFRRGEDLQNSDAHIVFATLDECIALCENSIVIGTAADTLMAAAPLNAKRVLDFDLPDAALFAATAAAFKTTDQLPQPMYLREPDAKPSPAPPHLTTRGATPDDLPRMAVLHAMAFDKGWSETSFSSALALPGSGAIVVEFAGELRGFVQFQTMGDEAEINTICVEPRWRKRGLAQRLLVELRAALAKTEVGKLHLEVAEDNASALNLYARFGFVEVGRRKGYYARRDADAAAALLMSLVI